MNRLRKIVLALATFSLLFSASVLAPAQIAATGDCGAANVYFYSGHDWNGSYVKYCWGVNDVNMEGPVIPVTYNLGPLHHDGYSKDFRPLDGNDSGINSMKFHDATGGINANLCLYFTRGSIDTPGNLMAYVHTPGSYRFPVNPSNLWDATPGRFFWTTLSSAAC